MTRALVFIAAAFTLLSTYSCARNSEEDFLPKATIVISSPVQSSVYRLGDTIFINASCVGEHQLHGYEVSIKEEGSTENLFFQHHHEHSTSLQVAEQWKNTLQTATPLVVEVSAILDEAAHKKTETVHFRTSN